MGRLAVSEDSGKEAETRREKRKMRKVLVERKRRERIDRCLDQLKAMVLLSNTRFVHNPTCNSKTVTTTPTNNSIEKADILELTIQHIADLSAQLQVQELKGYLSCAEEAEKYFRSTFPCCKDGSRCSSATGFSDVGDEAMTLLLTNLLQHLNRSQPVTGCVQKDELNGGWAAKAQTLSGIPELVDSHGKRKSVKRRNIKKEDSDHVIACDTSLDGDDDDGDNYDDNGSGGSEEFDDGDVQVQNRQSRTGNGYKTPVKKMKIDSRKQLYPSSFLFPSPSSSSLLSLPSPSPLSLPSTPPLSSPSSQSPPSSSSSSLKSFAAIYPPTFSPQSSSPPSMPCHRRQSKVSRMSSTSPYSRFLPSSSPSPLLSAPPFVSSSLSFSSLSSPPTSLTSPRSSLYSSSSSSPSSLSSPPSSSLSSPPFLFFASSPVAACTAPAYGRAFIRRQPGTSAHVILPNMAAVVQSAEVHTTTTNNDSVFVVSAGSTAQQEDNNGLDGVFSDAGRPRFHAIESNSKAHVRFGQVTKGIGMCLVDGVDVWRPW